MMNWWYWCSLQLCLVIGILLGALVFSHFEAPNEVEVRSKKLTLAIDVIETFLLQNSSKFITREDRYQLIENLFSTCNLPEPSELRTAEDYTAPVKWSFPNSVLFCYTIVTTIGYGHISPETFNGRLFCIFFGLVGIPLNVLLVGMLAGWFNSQMAEALPSNASACTPTERWLQRLAGPIFYLIPGTILFLVIPGIAFIVSENWTFLESVYYAFVTLTTIGFGDMVSGVNQKSEYVWLHNGILILWIMFGLGYITAVLEVIGKTFTSKPLQCCVELPKKVQTQVSKMVFSPFKKKVGGTSPQETNNNVCTDGSPTCDTTPFSKSGFLKDNMTNEIPTLEVDDNKQSQGIFFIHTSTEPFYDNPGFEGSPVSSRSNSFSLVPDPDPGPEKTDDSKDIASKLHRQLSMKSIKTESLIYV